MDPYAEVVSEQYQAKEGDKKRKKKQAKEEEVEEENADELHEKKLDQVPSKMDEHDQMLSNEK